MEESIVIKRKRKWIEENKKRKCDGCDEDSRKETESKANMLRKFQKPTHFFVIPTINSTESRRLVARCLWENVLCKCLGTQICAYVF